MVKSKIAGKEVVLGIFYRLQNSMNVYQCLYVYDIAFISLNMYIIPSSYCLQEILAKQANYYKNRKPEDIL